MSPNTVIIFGNPKVGTPIMQDQPSAGIDLPVKLQVYVDKSDRVQVAYNSEKLFEDSHRVRNVVPTLAIMKRALAAIVKGATQ